jgi:signal transduction histidine kinase/CheY-like chemotaxis protein
VVINTGDGPPRIIVATSNVVPDGRGGSSGRVGIVADVTAEVNVEAALSDARDKATEASALKSDFLANMSHEIRTPMNGVIGMTDLLLETDLDPTQRDFAQTVRNSGEALLVIINDILDFSKIEAGKLDVEAVDFNIRSVVDGVADLLRSGAQLKGLGLQAVVDADLPVVLRGDPGRLRQVLTNLVGNALKFTHTGEVSVRVTSESRGVDESLLRFEVTDSGVGIAVNKVGDIFQPFVQADSSTSRKYGGTGLGLAISAELVRLMGGDCGVSSELGVGSVFWFTVAVGSARDRWAAANASAYRQRPSPNASALKPLAGQAHRYGRLLLAEDNPVNEKVATAILTRAGYDVDAVPNGAAAVAAAKSGDYDAILMDCQMPELNGYEATSLIRSTEGADNHVPIIAMTAGARREDREKCLASGMDDYISKPVSKDALVAIVARWLARNATTRQADRPRRSSTCDASRS